MPRFLAIDWDQNQLHVVSATVGGGAVKIQRAGVWQEEQSPNPADAEALGRLLRERLKAAGISPAPVLACVGRDRVILKDIRHPAVPETEEANVVRFQAIKELTDPPDEVVIDYTSSGEAEANGERKALVLIVRKELLTAYEVLCRAAGLKLAGLTPRPFGIAASLRKVMGTTVLTPAPEPADGVVAVVTVSDRWAEFCVLRGSTLLLARSLAVGPGLAGEVRRNLAVYAGQNAGQPVRAVYLAGAGGELRERLTALLEVPVHSFDPFGGAERAELPAAHRGSFAGAVGLLHLRAEPKGLPINFVQPKQSRPATDPNRKRILIAAAVALLVVGLGALYGRSLISDYENELRQLEADRAELDLRLTQAREDGRRLKALDEWDSVVWLDELYDLADRIPDVNALRITKLTADTLIRSAKQPHAAKITIEGRILDQRSRTAAEQLVDQFAKDPYYSPLPLSGTFPKFTISSTIDKRPPEEYKRKLPAPKKVDLEPEDFGFPP